MSFIYCLVRWITAGVVHLLLVRWITAGVPVLFIYCLVRWITAGVPVLFIYCLVRWITTGVPVSFIYCWSDGSLLVSLCRCCSLSVDAGVVVPHVIQFLRSKGRRGGEEGTEVKEGGGGAEVEGTVVAEGPREDKIILYYSRMKI